MKRRPINRKKFRTTNVYPFLTRMYRLFRTAPEIFILKKLRYEGDYNPDTDVIRIDYRKEFVSTLVHEVLHYLYPKWTEWEVIHEERRIMNSLTLIQVKHILKKFSHLL